MALKKKRFRKVSLSPCQLLQVIISNIRVTGVSVHSDLREEAGNDGEVKFENAQVRKRERWADLIAIAKNFPFLFSRYGFSLQLPA